MLGSGTYGKVAPDNGKGVVKCFKPRAYSAFLREAIIHRYLCDLPTVAALYGVDAKKAEISMERCSMTLCQWLSENPSVESRVAMLRNTITALDSIQKCGIIHADIKLENIMVAEDGRVVFIDWNLAGPPGHARSGYTTPVYKEEDDESIYQHDIFSLGIAALELFSGKLLRGNMTYSRSQEILASTAIPPELSSIVSSMLVSDKTQRPLCSKLLNAEKINDPPEEQFIQINWPTAKKKKGTRSAEKADSDTLSWFERMGLPRNVEEIEKGALACCNYLSRHPQALKQKCCYRIAVLAILIALFTHDEVSVPEMILLLVNQEDRKITAYCESKKEFFEAVEALLNDREFSVILLRTESE